MGWCYSAIPIADGKRNLRSAHIFIFQLPIGLGICKETLCYRSSQGCAYTGGDTCHRMVRQRSVTCMGTTYRIPYNLFRIPCDSLPRHLLPRIRHASGSDAGRLHCIDSEHSHVGSPGAFHALSIARLDNITTSQRDNISNRRRNLRGNTLPIHLPPDSPSRTSRSAHLPARPLPPLTPSSDKGFEEVHQKKTVKSFRISPFYFNINSII